MLDLSELDAVMGVDRRDDERQSVIDRLRFDDALDIPPALTDEEMWSNYVDDDLYELDKAVRKYLSRMRGVQERKGGIRTSVPLLFRALFGRAPNPHDGGVCRTLHRIMEYYCTSYTGKTTIGGVRCNRAYAFSRYAARRKRPYSLRLRMEEASKRGSGRPFVPYGTGVDKGPAPRK